MCVCIIILYFSPFFFPILGQTTTTQNRHFFKLYSTQTGWEETGRRQEKLSQDWHSMGWWPLNVNAGKICRNCRKTRLSIDSGQIKTSMELLRRTAIMIIEGNLTLCLMKTDGFMSISWKEYYFRCLVSVLLVNKTKHSEINLVLCVNEHFRLCQAQCYSFLLNSKLFQFKTQNQIYKGFYIFKCAGENTYMCDASKNSASCWTTQLKPPRLRQPATQNSTTKLSSWTEW